MIGRHDRTAGATVLGLGAWTPGFPDAASWRQAQPRAEVISPPPRLPARLRRRASLLTRMVAEVAAQATEQAGVSLQGLPVVMGSAYGELMTTMEMLEEMETGQPLSPSRFHNSVHNTATGYLSMAADNQAPCTALAAGNDTVAMVLQEALALLADRGGDVLVVLADEQLPLEISSTSQPPLAAALLLRSSSAAASSPTPTPSGTATGMALAWLGDLRQEQDPRPAVERPSEESSPCASIFRLLTAIQDAAGMAADPAEAVGAERRPTPVRVELTAGPVARWSLAVGVALAAPGHT
ncbi:MAG: beta-ketoacyl synthase chain length factor [Polyangia bacterium]